MPQTDFTKTPRINPEHEAADAFWKYWRDSKHGYYESTWGAINVALAVAGVRLEKRQSSCPETREIMTPLISGFTKDPPDWEPER